MLNIRYTPTCCITTLAIITQEEGCTIRQLDDILQDAEATGGRLTPQQQAYASWVVQQDRLLYLAFYLLLNLAEDTAVEKKMRKKVWEYIYCIVLYGENV